MPLKLDREYIEASTQVEVSKSAKIALSNAVFHWRLLGVRNAHQFNA